ncbi:MAG: hypothetical protein KF833_08515 [Verrucomicrobiae bacterium]|nr:hypothetical protein [Verrucomicrobiae bacterium]
MALVQGHIDKIENDWRRFRSERPERRYTYIQVDTSGDGALGVFGIVAAQEFANEIIQFLEDTKPQRPVISHLQVWDSESFMDDGGALELLERQIQWIEGQRAMK